MLADFHPEVCPCPPGICPAELPAKSLQKRSPLPALENLASNAVADFQPDTIAEQAESVWAFRLASCLFTDPRGHLPGPE